MRGAYLVKPARTAQAGDMQLNVEDSIWLLVYWMTEGKVHLNVWHIRHGGRPHGAKLINRQVAIHGVVVSQTYLQSNPDRARLGNCVRCWIVQRLKAVRWKGSEQACQKPLGC